jgi:hypothetical protein
MWQRRPIRVGVYVLLGFVIGSLILGTYKGNSFADNLVYGLWTGALGGLVAGGLIAALTSGSR